LIEEGGIDNHPDFVEHDAAEKPGVQDAREILERLSGPPNPGVRRKVTIIDEAQRLSPEAWDVYLKPLEQPDTDFCIIFVSNEVEKIKYTIRTRCMRVAFERVDKEVLVGFLKNVANQNGIPCELEALRIVARHSHGIVREAVNILNSVAPMGNVTVDVVKAAIDTSVEDKCIEVMQAIAARNQTEAVRLIDEAGRKATPIKVIETMFSIYGRAVFAPPDSEFSKIYVGLPNVSDVTAIFNEWGKNPNQPADILPLFAYSLLRTQSPDPRNPVARRGSRQPNAPMLTGGFTAGSLKAAIDGAPPPVPRVPPPAAEPEKPKSASPEAVLAYLNNEEFNQRRCLYVCWPTGCFGNLRAGGSLYRRQHHL
jgi:hypothetical protein